MKSQKKFNIVISILVAIALLGSAYLLGYEVASARFVDYQVMSASGYAFQLKDGEGNSIFSISDAGNTVAAGSLTATGAIDANSTADFADTVVFSKGSGTALDVSSGGELNIDGTLDVNGTSNFGAAVTCSYAGNCLTSGTTADIEWLGFAAFGDGTPDGVTDGAAESVYVEGSFEVDGTTYADGAIDLDGSADEIQLAVTGYTTQTTDLAFFDGGLVDIGGGTYATADGDNDLGIDGDLEINGAVDADGTMNVAGNTTLQALLLTSFTNLTVTNGSTLTPTVTVYALDSAGAVTMTLAASGTEGQLLILIGDDANDITIADTNLRSNDGGVQVLNAYDVLMLVYQDAEWIEISESNNS